MLQDVTLYTFIYGSCVYWSCFLLCDLTFTKAIAKAAVYTIITIFYAGIGALYFMTAFSSLTFIEYIIGFLPFIIIPLLYKDSVAKIVFTYFSSLLYCLIIHLFSNILTNHIFTAVSEMNLINNLTPDILFRIITLGMIFLYLIFLFFMIKHMFHNMLANISNKVVAVACILPVLAFVILLVDYVMLPELTDMNGNVIALLTLILLILSVYVILYFVFVKAGNNNEHPKDTNGKQPTVVKKEIVSDPMDLLTSGRHYYEMLLNHYIDMNNRTKNLDTQMQTMNSLLVNDNVAGASVFVDRISQTFHDHDVVTVCNNQSLNLLFSYWHYICKQQQIYLETHIDLPSQLPIPDLDLCILFGNCIENAVEACGYVKDMTQRFINVDGKIQNGTLVIVMDNAFDGFINKVNNRLKSRKKFGGIGLKTVQAVVGKYQGSIDMEYPENVFTIFLKIPLKQKKVQKEWQNEPKVKQRPTRKRNE